jgi:hypothetical protein
LFDLRADPGEGTTSSIVTPSPRRDEAGARAGGVGAGTCGDRRRGRRGRGALRSLGYTAASAAPARRHYREADDPKRLVALNERFNTALEAFSAGRPARRWRVPGAGAGRPDFLTARTSAATVMMAAGAPPTRPRCSRRPGAQASAPEILAKLGAAIQRTGDLPAAAAVRRSRAAGNQNPEIFNDLGVVYARWGSRARRARCFRSCCGATRTRQGPGPTWGSPSWRRAGRMPRPMRFAMRWPPTRPMATRGRGWRRRRRARPGRRDRRLAARRTAAAAADLLFNLGMVLADSGRGAEARPIDPLHAGSAAREKARLPARRGGDREGAPVTRRRRLFGLPALVIAAALGISCSRGTAPEPRQAIPARRSAARTCCSSRLTRFAPTASAPTAAGAA